jgi:hypothetical protein
MELLPLILVFYKYACSGWKEYLLIEDARKQYSCLLTSVINMRATACCPNATRTLVKKYLLIAIVELLV